MISLREGEILEFFQQGACELAIISTFAYLMMSSLLSLLNFSLAKNRILKGHLFSFSILKVFLIHFLLLLLIN